MQFVQPEFADRAQIFPARLRKFLVLICRENGRANQPALCRGRGGSRALRQFECQLLT